MNYRKTALYTYYGLSGVISVGVFGAILGLYYFLPVWLEPHSPLPDRELTAGVIVIMTLFVWFNAERILDIISQFAYRVSSKIYIKAFERDVKSSITGVLRGENDLVCLECEGRHGLKEVMVYAAQKQRGTEIDETPQAVCPNCDSEKLTTGDQWDKHQKELSNR